MAELAGLGLLEPCGNGRFRLTECGEKDARLRFVDEFEDVIAPEGKGHGQCGPDCPEHFGHDAKDHRR
jgi:hypothetical protein